MNGGDTGGEGIRHDRDAELQLGLLGLRLCGIDCLLRDEGGGVAHRRASCRGEGIRLGLGAVHGRARRSDRDRRACKRPDRACCHGHHDHDVDADLHGRSDVVANLSLVAQDRQPHVP